MASSPPTYPLFFPTTILPPPPFGFGAPATGSFLVPAYGNCAATYPPPLPPGDYSTFPFPFFYGVPPSFPYPPAASAYTPASGFSPNWPPPSLDPTPSTMPPTFSSFPAPTFGAPTTTPALPESTAPPAMDSTPLPAYHASSPPKDVGKFPVRFSPPPPAETPATTPTRRPDKVRSTPIPSCSSRPTTPSREHRPPQSHASYTPSDPIPTDTPRTYCSSPKTSRRRPPITTPPSPMSEASSLLEIPDRASRFELPAYVSALTEMEPVFSASKAQQNKQDTSSVASLPDSFSGATSGSSVSSTIPAPTLLFGFRSSSVSTATSNTSSRCSSDPSKSPSTAAASVAPQMFDAMPTPRSDVENYCYVHTTPVQSSCVHGESANLGEQPVDEVPESYGFNNLSSHSVFLADGTECIYYALPENFALERVVPEPVFVVYDDKPDDCSNEFVHVFTSTPEEHSHEEEKQETEQLLRCFSKQQDDERACNCPVLKAYNSDITRSTQLCTAPSVTELRLLWDPGALHMHSGITINSTRTTTDTEWSKFSSPTSCELPQSASVQWSILSAQHFLDSTMKKGSTFSAGRPLPWDQWSAILLLHHGLWEFSIRPATRLKWNPGVPEILHSYTAIHSTEVDVQQLRDLPLKVLVTHESRKEWDPGDSTVLSSALKRAIVVVLKTLMLTTSGIFTLPYVLTVRVQFGMPTCVTQQSCYGRVLYIQENYGIQFLWDPGILKWWTISAQHILESGGIFSTERILPWNQWILDALLHVQYYCLLIVLGCLYPEPVQQLVCSSSLFSSTAMSMLIATTVGMRLVLGSGKIAQEEKYVAVMYQLLKTQIQMSKTSHIWDPGIKFIFYELWWLSQKTGYVLRHLLAVKFGTHNYTYFIGTAASMCWPPANSVQQRRNIAALLPFHQCILLSSAVCPWDPGIAFVYRQGVHENCNAMNQLPTEICLQIWRMNIIFITFLPP